MNGKVWGLTILPEQMHIVNPVLVLAFIPLFELVVYPVLAKFRLIRDSMQKLFWGGIVAAVAFGMSAAVEYTVEVIITTPQTESFNDVNLFSR